MGILSKIFGTGDVIKEGFKLIDSMHTSEGEAIEAKTKAKTNMLAAYEPFKLAQRYLAIMFAVTFLSCFVLVLGMTLAGIDPETLNQVRAVMAEFNIGWIMFTIVGFYFAGGAFEGVVNAKKVK